MESDDILETKIEDFTNKNLSKPLVIFKTEADKCGTDIAAMSNFFDCYIQQMSVALRQQTRFEIVSEFPIANLGIINDLLQQATVTMQGNITLVPDFDSLPSDIKSKIKNKKYRLGNSKQVDGNMRAVILDENGVRIKDITLKKVISDSRNIETVRSITNQLQMRQIFNKLTEISEFQTYQLERDRNRDIVVPFLDARDLILAANNKPSDAERMRLLREADGKMITALNSVYADIKTTSESLANSIRKPFVKFANLDQYMGFITRDLQIAPKYVGVRMQLLEYMEDTENAMSTQKRYLHVMNYFLTKSITRKGLSSVELMHDYYPYNNENKNFWHTFSKEMQPILTSSNEDSELRINGGYINDVYLVSVEDDNDEKEK